VSTVCFVFLFQAAAAAAAALIIVVLDKKIPPTLWGNFSIHVRNMWCVLHNFPVLGSYGLLPTGSVHLVR
jgi:hypothetical protein